MSSKNTFDIKLEAKKIYDKYKHDPDIERLILPGFTIPLPNYDQDKTLKPIFDKESGKVVDYVKTIENK